MEIIVPLPKSKLKTRKKTTVDFHSNMKTLKLILSKHIELMNTT